MAARAELPPAVAALVEAGVALIRRAPSARIAIARLGGVVELDALPAELREAAAREIEAARASVCVELPLKEIEAELKSAWGRPAKKVLDELDPEPLAITPTAQVHRGELDDGTAVAIKVRRPGIERSVRNDLALLDVLVPPLRAAFPKLDAGAILRDIREQVLDELDFEHEASTLRRLSRAVRGIDAVAVPRPDLELSTPEVLVSTLVEGDTLASGARPKDGVAAARTLIAAFRAAVLETGLAPYDLRDTHVLVGRRGTLGLLGLGVARPVDRARAQVGLRGLTALGAGDAGGFAAVVGELGVLQHGGAGATGDAYALLRELGGDLAAGPARLDAGALLDVAGRARRRTPDLLALGVKASPEPADLTLARMLGQLVAVLARLEATEDWPAVAAAG